jgi:DNA-directed RNA polymerase specialized sigma24 family protein
LKRKSYKIGLRLQLKFNSNLPQVLYGTDIANFQSETCEIQDWLHLEEHKTETDIKEEIVEYIRNALNVYTVYERLLCTEHILNGLSYSEIGREYGINRKYVAETVTPVRTEIYKKVRELWNY